MQAVKLSLSDLPIISAVFPSPFNANGLYVATEMESDAFRERYPYADTKHDYAQATPVNFDASPIRDDLFWMCYCEDCAFPPIAIVKADDIEEAIDEFVENCKWAQMEQWQIDEIIKDGGEDTIGYTGQGVAYDLESLMARPITLLRVDVL